MNTRFQVSLFSYMTLLSALICWPPAFVLGQVEIVYPETVPGTIQQGEYQYPGTIIQQPGVQQPIIQQPGVEYPSYPNPVYPNPGYQIYDNQLPGTIVEQGPVENPSPGPATEPNRQPVVDNTLQKRLDAANLNFENSKKENVALNSKIDELQTQSKQLTIENTELKTRITSLDQSTKSLTAEIGELRNRAQPMDNSNELTELKKAHMTNMTELETKLQTSEQTNGQLAETISTLKTANTGLENQVEQLTKQAAMNDNSGAITEANQRIQQLGQTNNELQTLVQNSVTEKETLEGKIEMLTTTNTDLTSKLETLATTNTDLTSKMETLTTTNTGLASKMETLTTTNTGLVSEIADLKSAAEKVAMPENPTPEVSSKATTANAAQTKQLADLTSRYNKLDSNYKTLQTNFKELETNLENSQTEVNRLTSLNTELNETQTSEKPSTDDDAQLGLLSGGTDTLSKVTQSGDGEGWGITGWIAAFLFGGLAIALFVIAKEELTKPSAAGAKSKAKTDKKSGKEA